MVNQRRLVRASPNPTQLMASDRPRENTALVPTTRFASAMFLAPTHCPTMMFDAIEKPNITPNNRNITTFEFPTAAREASPKYLPTQIELIEPLNDCRTLPKRIGRENASKARGIDLPLVAQSLACFEEVSRAGFGDKEAAIQSVYWASRKAH